MRLSTRKIPPEGLDLDFAIPASSMATGLHKKDQFFNLFENEVSCQFHFEIDKAEVFLSGNVQTNVKPVCDRCGDVFEKPLSIELSLTCSPEKGWHGSDSYQESDEGLIFYTNEELDLTEIVREQVLLTLPMRLLCRPDCKGLCPHCGVNLNLGEHTCSHSQPTAV